MVICDHMRWSRSVVFPSSLDFRDFYKHKSHWKNHQLPKSIMISANLLHFSAVHYSAEQAEDRMESVQDYEEDQLSSTGDSEEDESSSVETKTDGELIESVYYLVCIQW